MDKSPGQGRDSSLRVDEVGVGALKGGGRRAGPDEHPAAAAVLLVAIRPEARLGASCPVRVDGLHPARGLP